MGGPLTVELHLHVVRQASSQLYDETWLKERCMNVYTTSWRFHSLDIGIIMEIHVVSIITDDIISLFSKNNIYNLELSSSGTEEITWKSNKQPEAIMTLS